MSQLVWLLYFRERGFDRLITDRLFGVFSSEKAVLEHLDWRLMQGYGVGEGWWANSLTVNVPHQPTGHYSKDVVHENGQFKLVDQTVTRELAKERS